jgi:hypothetical protein
MSVRLFHRGARLVIVAGRGGEGGERWWSPHWTAPDWNAILEPQLQLLGLVPEKSEGLPRLRCRLGEINWIAGRRWSIITLQLSRGSDTKRRLAAAALLKAARYARPGR